MDWNEALKAARAEQRELIQKRDELDAARAEIDFEAETIDQRVVQLEHTIASLAELTGANKMPQRLAPIDLNNLKLADACRKILMSSNKYWTPINVRDALLAQNYDLAPYNNPLASIHAVLKRLLDSGEAVRTAGPDGKAMYRWKEKLPEIRGTFNPTFPTILARGNKLGDLKGMSAKDQVLERLTENPNEDTSTFDKLIGNIAELGQKRQRSNFLKAIEEVGKSKKDE